MGMTPGGTSMNLLKGGMTGLSQGLQNYQNPNQGFDFSKLQQGFQANRPALAQGANPYAKKQQQYQDLQNMNPFSATPWTGSYT